MAAVLTLMTGVALEMGLLVVELMLGAVMLEGWGLRGINPVTGATWPGMTCCVEKRGLDALALLTGVTTCGVTCWVEKQGVGAAPGAGCSPGSTLSQSMLLHLPLL